MAEESKESALTAKQEAFCLEYLKDLNATQAAIRAGYSQDTAYSIGSENLSKPEVAARLQALMDERASRTRIDADYVLQTVRETIERCRQAEPVLDSKGMPIMSRTPAGELAAVYAFRPQEVLKGCDLLGKHLKLFADRIEHTGKDGAAIETKVTGLSDAELDARLALLLEKAKGTQE